MQQIKSILDLAADATVAAIVKRFKEQGHTLTGAFERSIAYKVKETADAYIYEFEALYYGKIVDRGVAAARIPFSGVRRGGKGKTSLYIEALIAYGKKRGVKNAKSFAFAVAHKQKKEGMPTRASRRFSASGRRKMFLGEGIADADKLVQRFIDVELPIKIEAIFSSSL